MEAAPDAESALAHAEKAKVALGGREHNALDVKASTVIADHDPHLGGGTAQRDFHVASGGVLLHVPQGFLNDAIDGDEDSRRQVTWRT